MSTLRYTNGILTVIVVCLIVLVVDRLSLIPAAQAQPTTQPTPVVIVGWSLKQGPIPVNLAALGGHKSVPVAIVSQAGDLSVQVADAVAVKNPSDGTPLAVKSPSDGTALNVEMAKPTATPK